MNKRIGAALVALLVSHTAYAQQPVSVQPRDSDDASIATGQSNTNVNGLGMAYDGSVWRRVTFGTAGTASSQVWTVQGIASMTPLSVQSNGANLATETTLGNVLTSSNFAAAFGTAGSADTQVISIQGIASMTAVQVADNGGSLTVDGTVTVTDGAGSLNVIVDSGTVTVGSITAGDNDIGNVDVEFGGSAAATGSGVNGSTVQRVTIATDDATATNIADIESQLTSGVNIKIAGSDPLAEVNTATLQNAATSAADGTLLTVNGYATAVVTVAITGSGDDTVAFKVSQNGSDFIAVRAYSLDTPGLSAESTATTGTTHWVIPVQGFQHLMADLTVCTSCTVTVTGRAVFAPSPLPIARLEDSAHVDGDLGVPVLTRRIDTAASSAGTSGDLAMANTDSLGRLWVRGGNPCQDHARLSTAAISTSSSGNVEIVALNGSDLIYVCGYSVVAGAATGVQFIHGTGTACATDETDLTGVWSFAANGGITQTNAGAPQFVVPAGKAFCVENSGANAIAGHVTYVRTAAP